MTSPFEKEKEFFLGKIPNNPCYLLAEAVTLTPDFLRSIFYGICDFLRIQGVFAGSVTRSQELLLLPGLCCRSLSFQAGLSNPFINIPTLFPFSPPPPSQFSHFSSTIRCQLFSVSPQLNPGAAQTLIPVLGLEWGGIGILWEGNTAQLIGVTGDLGFGSQGYLRFGSLRFRVWIIEI